MPSKLVTEISLKPGETNTIVGPPGLAFSLKFMMSFSSIHSVGSVVCRPTRKEEEVIDRAKTGITNLYQSLSKYHISNGIQKHTKGQCDDVHNRY